MNAGWAKFGIKKQISESSYNAAVAGSNSLGAGVHEGVTLAGVEAVETDKNGNPVSYHAYNLIWEAADGRTAKEMCFVTNEEKVDGVLTGERVLNSGFIRMCLALSGNDSLLNKQFFLDSDGGAFINKNRMAAAIGTKATIVIGLPKTGFTVRNVDGKVAIFDIESGEQDKELGTFDSYDDLKAKAKEEGIKLAYNKVKFHKVFPDAAATNQQQISDVMEASSTAKKAGSLKSAGSQGF